MVVVLGQNQYQGPPQERDFIEEIKFSLRSIPHLPAALAQGTDDPSATPEERELRKRALSEAAFTILPAVVSGGTGALLKGLGRPLLTTILGDAAGLALGSGVSAQIEGGDVGTSAAFGAGIGGAIGGARGYFARGAALAAERAAAEAAEAASREASERQLAMTQTGLRKLSTFEEAGHAGKVQRIPNTPDIELSGAPLAGAPKPAPGTQLDVFDAGLPPLTGEPNIGRAGQLSLFGDAPSVPGARTPIPEDAPLYDALRRLGVTPPNELHEGMIRANQKLIEATKPIQVNAPLMPPGQLQLPIAPFPGPLQQELFSPLTKPSAKTGLPIARTTPLPRTINEIVEAGEEIPIPGKPTVGPPIGTQPELFTLPEATGPAPPRPTTELGENVVRATREEHAYFLHHAQGKSVRGVTEWIAEDMKDTPFGVIAQRVAKQLEGLEARGVSVTWGLKPLPRGVLGHTRTGVEKASATPHIPHSAHITLSSVVDRSGASRTIFLHEAVHAVTVARIDTDNAIKRELEHIGRAVHKFVANKKFEGLGLSDRAASILRDPKYYTDADEVLAWALSDREMQKLMENVPYGQQTVWSGFVKLIRKLLGLTETSDSALTRVLAIADEIMPEEKLATAGLSPRGEALEQLNLLARTAPEREALAAERLLGIPAEAAPEPVARAPRITQLAHVTKTYAPDQVLRGASETVDDILLREGRIPQAPGLPPKVQAGDRSAMDEAMLFFHRAFLSSRTTLRRMGDAGKKMAEELDDVFIKWRQTAGPKVHHVHGVLGAANWLGKKGLQDRIHIGEVMEGLAVPRTEAHRRAAEQMSALYAEYAQRAETLGMRTLLPAGGAREFIARGNYLTHFYDRKALKDALAEGTVANRRLLERAELHGITGTRREKMEKIRELVMQPPEFYTGPINFPRSKLLEGIVPYEKDILKVLPRYIYSVEKRLQTAMKFGYNNDGILPVYAAIRAEAGDSEARVAKRIFEAFIDRSPRDMPKLARALGTFNVVTMLTSAGVVQPAQLLNVAAVTGYKNLIKGLGEAMTSKESRRWVISTGAHLDEVIKDFMGTDPSDLSQFWLKNVIGLEPLDKMNRIIAALAGRVHAEELALRFVKKPSPRLAEQLQKLGIQPDEVLAQRGVLTKEQTRMAGFRVSIDTQFASQVLDLQEFRNSDAGRIVYMFRSFATQQSSFIIKHVLAPAKDYFKTGGKRGSLKPLMAYTAGLGPFAYTVGGIVRGMKGRPAPDDPRIQWLDNIALVGGFGIFYDTIRAMEYGPAAIASTLLGPTGGEMITLLGRDIPQAARGNPEVFAKHAIRRVPLIGPALSNYWLFPPED